MEEDKLLVAKFLGCDVKVVDGYVQAVYYNGVVISSWLDYPKKDNNYIESAWADLCFHVKPNDWNFVMQVVEKIESLGHYFTIEKHSCQLTEAPGFFSYGVTIGGSKIDAVYQLCLKFIKKH
jgi:hypothetical protein